MNRILIVDASESDRRLMSGLLVKLGYEPIAVKIMEAVKDIDMAILFCLPSGIPVGSFRCCA
jgi:CheY-like chemotaxis protein